MNDFWSYWYFHIPNFVLAAVMYTLLGRLVLGLVVPENWDNYIWRAFKAITDPVLKVVRFVTPKALADSSSWSSRAVDHADPPRLLWC